jgi:HAD superfamily hydrolase (TIGR01509 family)
MSETKFENIEAIILDKDGVFVDFNKVWLRVIAYRAQLIAERSSNTSEELLEIRNACISSMGVDIDLDTVDPYGPCSMPKEVVRMALATGLYMTKNQLDPNFGWMHSFDVIDDCMRQANEELKVSELSEEIPGACEKIKEIAEKFKVAIYTSDSLQNTIETLDKLNLAGLVSEEIQAGEKKNADNYSDLCARLNVDPQNTILISDGPNDIKAAKACGAKTIAVLSGVLEEDIYLKSIQDFTDLVLNSIADLDISNIEGPKKKLTI